MKAPKWVSTTAPTRFGLCPLYQLVQKFVQAQNLFKLMTLLAVLKWLLKQRLKLRVQLSLRALQSSSSAITTI